MCVCLVSMYFKNQHYISESVDDLKAYISMFQGGNDYLLDKAIFVLKSICLLQIGSGHTMASSKRPLNILHRNWSQSFCDYLRRKPAPWLWFRARKTCVVLIDCHATDQVLCSWSIVVISICTSSPSVLQLVRFTTVISLTTNTLSMAFSHHLQVFSL